MTASHRKTRPQKPPRPTVALDIYSAKLTACTVRGALGLHNGSFFVPTVNGFWHLAMAACRALAGYANLQHLGVPQWGPLLVQSR